MHSESGAFSLAAMSLSTKASEGDPPSGPSIRRGSSFFGRRFSNASLLTIGSINTILPQYSAVGNDEQPLNPPGPDDAPDGVRTGDQYYATPPPSEPSSGVPCSPVSPSGWPSRLSVVNPRHSTLLAWKTSNSTASADNYPARMDSCFQYSIPLTMPSVKQWATLHLSTRTTIAGNPRSSQTQPKLPRFWGCDPVTGVIQLDLDNPLTIQQINMTVSRPRSHQI